MDGIEECILLQNNNIYNGSEEHCKYYCFIQNSWVIFHILSSRREKRGKFTIQIVLVLFKFIFNVIGFFLYKKVGFRHLDENCIDKRKINYCLFWPYISFFNTTNPQFAVVFIVPCLFACVNISGFCIASQDIRNGIPKYSIRKRARAYHFNRTRLAVFLLLCKKGWIVSL